MPAKPKTAQPKGQQARDNFRTPAYGTDLLVPFIPRHVYTIWEPACGGGMMMNRLRDHGFNVTGSDIDEDFLTHRLPPGFDAIITNPPYSLKREFTERCLAYGLPFALLIPFDMSLWLCDAIRQGCRLLVPTRRIDYITPTGKSGKQSSAQFHSAWLCRGMLLPDQITIVELSQEAKREEKP